MKYSIKNILPGMIVGAMVLVAFGCVAEKNHLSSNEAKSSETQQLGYNSSSSQLNVSAHEIDSYITEEVKHDAASQEETTQTQVTEIQMEETAPLSSEIQELEAINEDTSEELIVAEDNEIIPPPSNQVFHFGFDKSELSAEAVEKVMEHAAYLTQHPDRLLYIIGHADAQGESVYNQYLSEQRAQKVAELLKQAGVKESQLYVTAMGDQISMENATGYKQNRRVEFNYQDSMFAEK
jgi:peptidoglycan-associated lipoprotein